MSSIVMPLLSKSKLSALSKLPIYRSTFIFVPGRARSKTGALNRGVSVVATTRCTAAGTLFLDVNWSNSPGITIRYLECDGYWSSILRSGSSSLACFRALSSGRYHCNESSSNTSRPLICAAGTIVTKVVSVCAPNISALLAFLLFDLL